MAKAFLKIESFCPKSIEIYHILCIFSVDYNVVEEKQLSRSIFSGKILKIFSGVLKDFLNSYWYIIINEMATSRGPGILSLEFVI